MISFSLTEGADVVLMVQMSAPEYVASVTDIRLHDTTGSTTLLTVSAELVPGLTEGVYRAQVTIPEEVRSVALPIVNSKSVTLRISKFGFTLSKLT